MNYIVLFVGILAFGNCTVALEKDIRAQGVFFSNESSKDILLELSIDGTKRQLDIPPSRCAYIFTEGKFAHPFLFSSDRFSGNVRNLSIGFSNRDGIRPLMISPSITEGESEFQWINPKKFDKKLLIKVKNDIAKVKLNKYEFILKANSK